MNRDAYRYVSVALAFSVGIASVLAVFLGPIGFVVYLVVFYVTYMNYSWLHNAIEKIANGKVKK